MAVDLTGHPGVIEAYAAFDTVGLIVDETFDPNSLTQNARPKTQNAKVHQIPVLYDGEDLEEVAQIKGLTVQGLIALHAREYECRAVGFCPGFAYLAPLPAEIDLPRRDTPRIRVAPGSVAIAAGMTAIYPLERPGGWWLIGRTPLTLVDEADEYFPISAGDRICFHPIDESEYASRMGERL